MDGKGEKDPNAENREILKRALREDQLRDLKYKAEKTAEKMGILYYDDYSTCEEYAARHAREKEQNESNQNYTGPTLPERIRRESTSDEDEEVIIIIDYES